MLEDMAVRSERQSDAKALAEALFRYVRVKGFRNIIFENRDCIYRNMEASNASFHRIRRCTWRLANIAARI